MAISYDGQHRQYEITGLKWFKIFCRFYLYSHFMLLLNFCASLYLYVDDTSLESFLIAEVIFNFSR